MRNLRVGIVGLSGISISKPALTTAPYRMPQPHSHAAAFHAVPEIKIVAVCDLDPDAIERYRTTWGEAAGYTGYREMFAAEQLDLISIATPDHFHEEIFVAACDAGVKGIFCEKPITTTLESADRMIAAAERSGVKTVVNHTRRHDPFYRHVKYLIDEGEIGPVTFITGTMGGQRAMLFRNGTHVIDTMLFLAGSSPSWLTAEFDPLDAGYGPIYKGDGGHDPATEPGALVMFGFPNGLRAVYNGSKRTVANLEIEVLGERGRIRIGNQTAELTTLAANGGLTTQPLPMFIDMTSGMVSAIQTLISLIDNDGDGAAALRDGRTTLEVLLGILVSADQNGRKLPLTSR